MLRLLLSFFLIPLFFTVSLQGSIIEKDNIGEALSELGELDQNTLIVFDIDHTLTIPKNPAFQYSNIINLKEHVEEYKKDWTDEHRNVVTNMMTLTGKSRLLNPQTVELIHQLQKRNIPVIALTAAMTGPYGEIDDPILSRRYQLIQLSIDFSKTAPSTKRYTFDQFEPYLGSYPQTQFGIVFAHESSKGEVLAAYLQMANWKPKRVIFFDDVLSHVELVEKSMQKMSIDFQGVHFTGMKHFKSDPITKEEFIKVWKSFLEETHQIYQERLKMAPL